MRIILFIYLLGSFLFSQIPSQYKLSNADNLYRFENITSSGVNSNSIVDIRSIDESNLLISTSNGLSYAYISDYENTDSIYFGSFNKSILSLPQKAGIPALINRENVIVISGIIDTMTALGLKLKGTGITYSVDEGENWTFLPQPVDAIPQEGKFHKILWGDQELLALSVTTSINNISYDLAIGSQYIYAASWAGMIRRFKFTDSNPT